MPLTPKDQILISTLLHRLLRFQESNREAITDTLAKPVSAFNEDDWELVHQALLLPSDTEFDLTSYLRFIRKIPP